MNQLAVPGGPTSRGAAVDRCRSNTLPGAASDTLALSGMLDGRETSHVPSLLVFSISKDSARAGVANTLQAGRRAGSWGRDGSCRRGRVGRPWRSRS